MRPDGLSGEILDLLKKYPWLCFVPPLLLLVVMLILLLLAGAGILLWVLAAAVARAAGGDELAPYRCVDYVPVEPDPDRHATSLRADGDRQIPEGTMLPELNDSGLIRMEGVGADHLQFVEVGSVQSGGCKRAHPEFKMDFVIQKFGPSSFGTSLQPDEEVLI
jgi:hypothetical protein